MAEPLRSGRVFSAPHVAGYWAKARAAIDGGPVWHPLAYHCLDVAAAADRLLANSPRRLEPLAGLAQTSPAALHGLFVLLIALHDIGKFSRRFQAKSGRRGAERHGGRDAHSDARHDAIGFALWDEVQPLLGRTSTSPTRTAGLCGRLSPGITAVRSTEATRAYTGEPGFLPT